MPITQSVQESLSSDSSWFGDWIKAHDVVVVKYEAPWCDACKEIEPTLEYFSDLYPDIPMIKVDIDENQNIKEWARIKAIPFVIMYKEGKMREFLYGVHPLEKYEQKLQRLLR